MPFQIKDFKSVTAGAINRARSVTTKITDFIPGSVARTLIEAPASEIEDLYIQMLLGLRDAIPVATYRSFGFDKQPAARAKGFLVMSLTVPPAEEFVVPLGTLFRSSDGREYRSTSAVTWPVAALSVRVPIEATIVGAAGNIAAGGITETALQTQAEAFGISNPAITTGKDVETDAEQKSRFAEYIRSLSRGTMPACRFAVGSALIMGEESEVAEYVTRVGEIEERGYVRFWIYSSIGRPSAQLLALAQRALDGWRMDDGTIVPGYRPAGVRVEALAMDERTVSMSINVSMYPGYALDAPTQQAITNVYESAIRGVPAGESMFLKSLVEQMLAVDGVRSIVPNRTENIYCGPSEALVPGTLAIAPL